jgi:hypothetical protein
MYVWVLRGGQACHKEIWRVSIFFVYQNRFAQRNHHVTSPGTKKLRQKTKKGPLNHRRHRCPRKIQFFWLWRIPIIIVHKEDTCFEEGTVPDTSGLSLHNVMVLLLPYHGLSLWGEPRGGGETPMHVRVFLTISPEPFFFQSGQ